MVVRFEREVAAAGAKDKSEGGPGGRGQASGVVGGGKGFGGCGVECG